MSDANTQPAIDLGYSDAGDIPLRYDETVEIRKCAGFWTRYYQMRFRMLGIPYGRGLRVLGRLLLQIDGKPANLQIGDNVTLMPGVHLKNRENGTIVLHDRSTLDTNARLVAANNATIAVGENASIGMGSIINAGRDVTIGRGTITAGYCYLNVSDHNFAKGIPIRDQGFKHAPIAIGEDAWLGAYVFVLRGARIGNGAVVSASSIVSGDIPQNAIVQGRPAEIVKFRE
ncbi:MAG: acyltransferase [Alphaproteobacteria bacterium]